MFFVGELPLGISQSHAVVRLALGFFFAGFCIEEEDLGVFGFSLTQTKGFEAGVRVFPLYVVAPSW